MRILVKNPSENALTLMRRAGYVFQRKEGDEMSFVREFARSGFPRFHAYVRTESVAITVNFHLDAKRETYGESTRHHGEYENDGPLAEEAKRLLKLFGERASVVV